MEKIRLPSYRFLFILIFGIMLAFLMQAPNPVNTADINDRYSCNGKQMTEAQIAEYRGLSLETMQLLHERRGLTIPEICEMPQSKLEQAIHKSDNSSPDQPGEESDQPDEAAKLRKLQLQDENGFIPADGLITADSQIEAMSQQVSIEGAGITNGSWVWLGPGNIGGRVRSLVIHPDTPTTMWAGSVTGGIWKTIDGGASWQPLDDFMASMSVSALIIDPNNPDILYAGTGEGFYPEHDVIGAGVFKTTNGGTNWTQLPSTNNPDFYNVNRLAISPDGSTILAATSTDIFLSTDGGGIWTDKGINDEILDINFDPSDSNKAVASGWLGLAWYSIDGGSSWTAAANLPAGADRVEIAYAPSNPTIVYASIDFNGGEIWKSTNGGQSYLQVNTGRNYLGDQGYYDNIIWVDPTNANKLIVGGVDLWRGISTINGVSLTKISDWQYSPLSAHADQHIIVEHPGFNGITNKTVYFGNDGGIYATNNVYTVTTLSGWTELNNNLGITQFYGAAGNPSTGAIIGGTQDNGTLLYTVDGGTEGWTTPLGGDGGFSAFDPTDPNYFYSEYTYLNIDRNDSGGANWSDYISGNYWDGSNWAWKNPPYRIDDAMNNASNFIAPIILDPNDSDRILGGGVSLWRTNDAKTANTNTSGPSWASIKASIGELISAIAIAPGNSNIIWVGYNNGDVYKTINGTNASPTWAQVDTNSPGLPNRYVTRITIDQNDNNKVYVTFGGFSPDNVWRTTNGGTNWADITGSGLTGLPNLPVRSLVINPTNSNWLYVGTELGIFTSENGGTNWTIPHDGPSNVSVDELFWMNTALVAATHGRGVFKTETLPCTTLTVTPPLEGGHIKVDPAPNCVGDDTKYSHGTVVTITAQANGGYALLNWSGDASGSTNPLTVTMTTDKSITAVFFKALSAPVLRSPRTNLVMNNNAPTFWWTNVRDGQTYEIEFATDNIFASNVNSDIVNGPPYIAALPFADGTYYWHVRARNASNQPGIWSLSRTFTIDTTGPAAPVLSSPGPGASTRTPTFKWLSVPGAVLYEFQYDNNITFSSLTKYTVTVRGTFRKPPAMPNGIYYWHVRAKDAAGNWSLWSLVPYTVHITGP